MWRIMKQDPEVAMQLIREAYSTTRDTLEFEATEVHIAVLDVFTISQFRDADLLDSMLKAGIMTYLRDSIASPNFFVYEENGDIHVGCGIRCTATQMC